MPAPLLQMYCREQIFITGGRSGEKRLPGITHVLKEFEKATMHEADRRGADFSPVEMLTFAHEWFSMRNAEENARLAEEEAWRQYWSGKRGEVKSLFDRFDLDGSGAISPDELRQVLPQLPDFFGYSEGSGVSETSIEGMAEWMREEIGEGSIGAEALFDRLDVNKDGQIEWEEFWEVVSSSIFWVK